MTRFPLRQDSVKWRFLSGVPAFLNLRHSLGIMRFSRHFIIDEAELSRRYPPAA